MKGISRRQRKLAGGCQTETSQALVDEDLVETADG